MSQGANAPISQDAASSYALALNAILADEDARFDVGPFAFCIWTKDTPELGKRLKRIIEKGFPEHVQQALGSVFSGLERDKVRNSERLHTVAISCATQARVAVKYWLDTPLSEAETKLGNWWNDLRVALFYRADPTEPLFAELKSDAHRASPYALQRLVMTTVRESKEHKVDKVVGERIVQLYRTALEGTAPCLMLLKPILDEFQSSLVKNDPKINPFNPSRFALIKLILLRNRKESDFMPTVELADTLDAAYNCGRLLAVMEELQNRSRKAGKTKDERAKEKRPNAGVIDRFYGRASSAPMLVFPILLHLSNHHHSKLQKGNEADRKAAGAFEHRKIDILSRLRAPDDEPNSPPDFPRLLTLAQQGRFALGFYQQKAHDLEQLRRYLESQGKQGDDLADIEDEAE